MAVTPQNNIFFSINIFTVNITTIFINLINVDLPQSEFYFLSIHSELNCLIDERFLNGIYRISINFICLFSY